jgi:antirestriction protein ArdC
MCKPFFVFNAAQIDGLPAGLTVTPAEIAFDPIVEAEKILKDSGADIRHGFDAAFYVPSKDQICMPNRERFISSETYYSTALHELTHWTGHQDRKAREFSKRFGTEEYAFEELVAELGSAYLVGHLGFADATIENHASYLQSWLKILKSDKCAIFTAAKHAGEAFDYVLSLVKSKEPELAEA